MSNDDELRSPAKGQGGARSDEFIIYAHSSILYWWPVWIYGGLCWAYTHFHNVTFDPTGSKSVKFAASPWLGVSFVYLMFFVILFSTVRVRGIYSILGVLGATLLGAVAHQAFGIGQIIDFAQLLQMHMNEAFYGAFASFLFILWVVVIFGTDKMTYWRISPGRVSEVHRLGLAPGVDIDARGMVARRLETDFFRHKVLGLGTGDIICKPSTAGAAPIILENVCRASHAYAELSRLIGRLPTV